MMNIARRYEAGKKWWKSTEEPSKLEWGLMLIVLLFGTAFFLYGDIQATIEHSFNLIDSVLQGRFFDFYQIAIENNTFGHPAVYDIPIYVIFAVWNIPIYLVFKMTGIDYLASFPCMLWSKLMVVLFVVLTARALYLLARELGIEKKRSKWIVFFFLTSTTLVIPCFVIVQYDIISVFVMLLGMKAYVRGEKRKFILYFILANTLKMFSLFIFIPLVLLKEKKIIRILGQCILGVSGLIACKLIFSSNVFYQISTKSFSSLLINRLQTTGFTWQYEVYVLPIFIVFIVGLFIYAYIMEAKDERELGYYAVYIATVAFVGLMTLILFNPYWMVLISPFILLVIFMNPRFFKLNILLETIISAILLFVSIVINYWVFGQSTMTRMLFGVFYPEGRSARFTTINDLFRTLGLDKYINFAFGALVACVIAFFIINYPSKVFRNLPMKLKNQETVERSVVWSRCAVPCMLIGMMLLLVVIPGKNMVYSVSAEASIDLENNLLQEGQVACEKIRLDKTLQVESVEVAFADIAFEWIDYSAVNFDIYLEDELLGHYESAANLMENGVAKFELADMVLDKDKTYLVKIYGTNGKDTPLKIKINLNTDDNQTTVGGKDVKGDLCMNMYGKEVGL
ncbi:hypothetical protein NK118_00200 [Lachnospiraceae bacterium PAL227]|uniref:DUF2029 domain-containing protein n=2 Tax=Ohessyouella blattaphilus TaxID=2949333 RepID=A0ABT1ED92_9FIRM|nr:hypothetical protein [Ohessyouella blattaphilus]MCP1108671.1 hypothetical protein [Ohessyouella blattaphilus]MCR8562065.1 hypothetical protein [Ohessyouella blattaphilus]